MRNLVAPLARTTVVGFVALSGVAALATACGGGDGNGDSPSGGSAITPPGGENGFDITANAGASGDARLSCANDAACPTGDKCVVGICQPPQGPCVSNAGCRFDAYCNAGGQCVPYGTAPENRTADPACRVSLGEGVLAPEVKCAFLKAPTGDPFPAFLDVQTTPIVVNFNPTNVLEGEARKPPSIVVPFTRGVANSYTENRGVIRVLRGTDCTLEVNLLGVDIDGNGLVDWARSSSPVAVADLDGDRFPEIVAFTSEEGSGVEGMVAFTRKNGQWSTLWATKKATAADGATPFNATIPATTNGSGNWAGPSIHDLDDDGKPEIIREGWVFDGQTGKLRAAPPAGYATAGQGLSPVMANLDADPRIELTNGARVWEFDGATNTWVADAAYNAVTTAAGLTALADFNPYDGKKQPEIVVVTSSSVAVYGLDHSTFMAPVAVPGNGGGPPTIADYDGDGLPEIGVAGGRFYTVFDPDCGPTPRPGGLCGNRVRCDGPTGAVECPANILWSRATQDRSSNVTGSSVFDFEADGKSEVVYADECFVRVYSGTEGKVLFSQYHSSCTWNENPVIADVDGDYRADMVVGSNTACGPVGVGTGCDDALEPGTGVDKMHAGNMCQKDVDCQSGKCDAGYCRCTASAQCCSAGNDAACLAGGVKCTAPPAGTPGTGNTCRAYRPQAGVQGLRVFRDQQNRWVRSRTIWNQHAYAVTHVNEDGTVPKTSAWLPNWTTAGLDNFRQNVPGTGNGRDAADLTSRAGPYFTCQGSQVKLQAPVCNRGSAPAGSGVSVDFFVGDQKVCSTLTELPVAQGACRTVDCMWSAPPQSASDAKDVTIRINDNRSSPECINDNNPGLVQRVFCIPPR